MSNPEDTPSDRPPQVPRDMAVENALLRGALWLATKSLKRYNDAPSSEIEMNGIFMSQVVVPAETREKAADAITRAERLLSDRSEGQSP
jgi:hypothetical protein